MQQAGAGGAAETVQERQRSGSCQVGGTAALRTYEAALRPVGILCLSAKVFHRGIQGNCNIDRLRNQRGAPAVFNVVDGLLCQTGSFAQLLLCQFQFFAALGDPLAEYFLKIHKITR